MTELLAQEFFAPADTDMADAHHNQFRLDGFQRIKKISAGRWRWILERERLGEIENGGRSVWWWARVRMGKA